MTVEIEYSLPRPLAPSDWQVHMAEQIETNQGIPIEEITRTLRGHTLIVSVETTLPDEAVENMLSDIEDHLPQGCEHVETREV
ncbi:hypothetical protein IL252_11380 [Halomicrobium sp. IBSBa]|uniref:hypothetical protein n=1 Tax=Halomicrobium sp. IBSBa TaxID=2778916 RepID=UPI001ABF0810|nr:hypothetical protein [Halomicrobium sp. IBSBa]MBO4248416.1 hypothetical protein [Halomicrobium sp. IBSBa]